MNNLVILIGEEKAIACYKIARQLASQSHYHTADDVIFLIEQLVYQSRDDELKGKFSKLIEALGKAIKELTSLKISERKPIKKTVKYKQGKPIVKDWLYYKSGGRI